MEVVCVMGESKSGKTTFLEKLIRVFVEMGLRVAVVKNDSHGFNIDIPGKDSWRFREAGAAVTAVIGPDKYAVIQNTAVKKTLDDITGHFENVDLVLGEGFRNSGKPLVEIVRRELGTGITACPDNLIAVVTDVRELTCDVPKFGMEDAKGVADFIIEKYSIRKTLS